MWGVSTQAAESIKEARNRSAAAMKSDRVSYCHSAAFLPRPIFDFFNRIGQNQTPSQRSLFVTAASVIPCMATVLQTFNDRLTSSPGRADGKRVVWVNSTRQQLPPRAIEKSIARSVQYEASRPGAPLLFRIVNPLDQHCCSFCRQRRAV
jgi:hypothetical protein